MNCPKCKNPVSDTAIVCEWCGVSFAKSTENKGLSENDLDAELIKRLERQSINSVVEFYQKTTGKSRRESYYYVYRLNFFRIHKFANEAAWEVEWKRINKFKKRGRLFYILAIVLFSPIFTPIFIILYNNNKKHLS